MFSSRGSETVLVVDDQEFVRSVMARSLRLGGYRVLEAAGGEKALAASGAHAGPIHLLVTDLAMPGMRGEALAQRLKADRPELRVLYVSGTPEDMLRLPDELRRQGAFLQKPFLPTVLLEKVREAIEGR